MNLFMFSSFVYDHKVRKIMQSLPHETIAYIPAGYNSTKQFTPRRGYYEMGFRRGMNFPLGRHYMKYMEDTLFSCDAIHIGGGNTFELLFMLNARGLLPKLKEYVDNGGILMGSSAGGIVMCPDIKIASFADNNWLGLFGGELEGLGLVDFYVKPHWEMWAKEKHAFQDFSKKENKKIICLRENQGVVFTDYGMEFLGGFPKVIHP